MSNRVLVGLLLLAAGPVSAQTTQPAAQAPATAGKSKQNLNRVICEVEDTIGTRLGARKVCKTALEWQQLRNEQRQGIERIQRDVGQRPSG